MKTSAISENFLLSAFPQQALSRLAPHLKKIELSAGTLLYEYGCLAESVYFPVRSILSIFNELEDGSCGEVALVGNEGMAGVSVFLSGETSPGSTIVQSSGSAYSLSILKLREAINIHREILTLLFHYTQSLFNQIAQTAICNRHHSIRQQLCRRLLLALDRSVDNDLFVTQTTIANWLGVRREGVSEAASYLQKHAIIEYQRGHVKVLDRYKLESLSCECYQVVKSEAERLLPYLAMDKNRKTAINFVSSLTTPNILTS